MLAAVSQNLTRRSAAVLATLETRFDRIMQAWLLIAGLACALRLSTAPMAQGGASMGTVLPYLLLILAPFAATVLALRWFARGDELPLPSHQMVSVGRWRDVSRAEAQRHPLYGAGGIMVSLLVGIMLNVPFRAIEYLTSMPPVPALAPPWLAILHTAMTFDAVAFSALYMVAFVAGLKRVPMFPRLLVAIWIADLGSQVVIAQIVSSAPGLPAAVADALHGVLQGNVKKVLISMAVWMPYLLMSSRVNVTYRHRVAD